jgi:hypothetical protein
MSSHGFLLPRGSTFLPECLKVFPWHLPAPVLPNLLDHQISRCFLARRETFEPLNAGRYAVLHSAFSCVRRLY